MQIVYSRCDVPFGFVGFLRHQVMDADGGNTRPASWAAIASIRASRSNADGTQIAFGSDRSGFPVGRVGRGRGWRWSPSAADETQHRGLLALLVLARRAADQFTDNCCRPHSNLWSVKPDGTGRTLLTDSAPGARPDVRLVLTKWSSDSARKRRSLPPPGLFHGPRRAKDGRESANRCQRGPNFGDQFMAADDMTQRA